MTPSIFNFVAALLFTCFINTMVSVAVRINAPGDSITGSPVRTISGFMSLKDSANRNKRVAGERFSGKSYKTQAAGITNKY